MSIFELVESVVAARVLLLFNYRPEYRHAWGGKSYYRQLRIDALPPESADELLDALLGGDVALGPLKQLLVERTESNPLFPEESVRALVEAAALVGERGAYRLTRPIESLRLPATVQAILAARIDRLAPDSATGRFTESLTEAAERANKDRDTFTVIIAAGTKSGYVFAYTGGTADAAGNVNDYTLTATPVTRQTTGQRTFFTDQSGVIRADATGTASATSTPI